MRIAPTSFSPSPATAQLRCSPRSIRTRVGAVAEEFVECLKQRPPNVVEPTLAEAPAQLGHLVGVLQRLLAVAREYDEGA